MDINTLKEVVLVICVVGLISAFTLQIMGETKADMTADSAEANATADAIEAVAKVPSKLPLVVTVIIGVVIIGLLITYFMGRK